MVLDQEDLKAIRDVLINRLGPDAVRSIREYNPQGARFRYPLTPSGEYCLEWTLFSSYMELRIIRYDSLIQWQVRLDYEGG